MAELTDVVGPSDPIVPDQPLQAARPLGVDQAHLLMALGADGRLALIGLGDGQDRLLDYWAEDAAGHLLKLPLDPVEVALDEPFGVAPQGVHEQLPEFLYNANGQLCSVQRCPPFASRALPRPRPLGGYHLHQLPPRNRRRQAPLLPHLCATPDALAGA